MVLEFKTKEELQLMPQTMEEHLEELEDDDSDTEDLSFSSLDDDNVHEVHCNGNWYSASSVKSYPSFKPFCCNISLKSSFKPLILFSFYARFFFFCNFKKKTQP